MKRLVLGILSLAFLPGWTQIGINFRNTSGYVTDGTNETYCACSGSSGESYPVSRGGATFGWTSTYSDQCRDRSTGVDQRLAGLHQADNALSPIAFQLDLPATGNYTICMAIGDNSSGFSNGEVELFDNTTSKFKLDLTSGVAAGSFADANGTAHTAANWPANHTCRTGVSFATTTLVLKIGSTTSESSFTRFAHLYVEQEATATAAPFTTMQILGMP